MAETNLIAAWIGFMGGFLAGALPGLFFHLPDWLGGYASWERRLIRLAHISFFGIGFINLAFALTAARLDVPEGPSLFWSSRLLLLGAVSMPAVCYLSAFRKGFRHFFFLPVTSLLAGAGLFIATALLP
jgi:hypothetical protein